MSNMFGLLVVLVVVLVFIVMPVYTIQGHKKKIRAVLESREVMNISMEYLPLIMKRMENII